MADKPREKTSAPRISRAKFGTWVIQKQKQKKIKKKQKKKNHNLQMKLRRRAPNLNN